MIVASIRRAYAALERFGALMFRQMDAFYERMWRVRYRRGVETSAKSARWPVTAGAYVVGNPSATVAVCALTSRDMLSEIAALPGVAIAGRLITCNLGIEKLIVNVCTNPNIRALLICGKDSPVFRPSQSLRSLFEHGVDAQKKIIGATGYLPVLQGVDFGSVDEIRRRIAVVDRTGLDDVSEIGREVTQLIDRLALRSEQIPITIDDRLPVADDDVKFKILRPGGKRESLAYDPKGYIVITVDRAESEIVARHYTPAAQPVHVMRGRSAEGMALALIREKIITQMTHAAYIGGELAKAETALRTGLEYEQDHPLGPGD
jgi:tetrahydromethanopterin S-methyltransferase subunit A